MYLFFHTRAAPAQGSRGELRQGSPLGAPTHLCPAVPPSRDRAAPASPERQRRRLGKRRQMGRASALQQPASPNLRTDARGLSALPNLYAPGLRRNSVLTLQWKSVVHCIRGRPTRFFGGASLGAPVPAKKVTCRRGSSGDDLRMCPKRKCGAVGRVCRLWLRSPVLAPQYCLFYGRRRGAGPLEFDGSHASGRRLSASSAPASRLPLTSRVQVWSE